MLPVKTTPDHATNFTHFHVFISAGSSSHVYTRGSFAHQLNKELDNIRNQRNKLGKYLYYVTGLIYFVLRP